MSLQRDLNKMCCSSCGRPFVEPARNGIHFEGNKVFMDGTLVPLSMTERELVRFMATSFGSMLPKERIRARIWASADVLDAKLIDMYVCKTRKKLAGTNFEIKTEWGFGYGLFRRAPVVGKCEQNRPTNSQSTSRKKEIAA